MKNWLKIFSISILFSISGFANAVLIDFAALADGTYNSDTGVYYFDGYTMGTNNEQGFDVFTITFDGTDIVLKITAEGGYAYLDKSNSKGLGGLGVCTNLTDSMQCNPSNDDNVSLDESLMFSFVLDGYEVYVDDFMITVNDNHDDGIKGDDNIDLTWMDDGGAFNLEEFNPSQGTTYTYAGLGKKYTTAYDSGTFYIESIYFNIGGFSSRCVEEFCEPDDEPVPEPSSLGILALCAILIAARKKKLI
ncbi:MAG: PEP-CTERM sorting domain-containing protein [Thalassotalea sp.]|nr:PEP-CTERM sorting domain-containing protein [Thalassotalea sp.]MDG2393931.1 PEP-CTERM sorting domain-containing protein [Thalassotalea sp.]